MCSGQQVGHRGEDGDATLAHAAVAGADGRIYAFGGWTSPPGLKLLATAEVYTPSINKWSSIADMPTARRHLAAVLGTDGRIFVTGGSDSGGATAIVDAYTPGTKKWETITSMPTERAGFAAVRAGDRIYAIVATHALASRSVFPGGLPTPCSRHSWFFMIKHGIFLKCASRGCCRPASAVPRKRNQVSSAETP